MANFQAHRLWYGWEYENELLFSPALYFAESKNGFCVPWLKSDLEVPKEKHAQFPNVFEVNVVVDNGGIFRRVAKGQTRKLSLKPLSTEVEKHRL